MGVTFDNFQMSGDFQNLRIYCKRFADLTLCLFKKTFEAVRSGSEVLFTSISSSVLVTALLVKSHSLEKKYFVLLDLKRLRVILKPLFL